MGSVLSQGVKDALIQKALGLNTAQLKALAKANNIGYSTLHLWRAKYRRINVAPSPSMLNKQTPGLGDRIKHVIATSTLTENELGVYCRTRGLYAVQLQEWKKEIMNMTADEDKKNKTLQTELNALKNELNALKKEILRKDKALAETAALLVLKKKAHLIWGEQQED